MSFYPYYYGAAPGPGIQEHVVSEYIIRNALCEDVRSFSQLVAESAQDAAYDVPAGVVLPLG